MTGIGLGLSRIAAALVFSIAIAGLPAQAAPRIDEVRAEILIKNTLAAFNQANLTGNYTVLRDLGSPTFRGQNNPAKLTIVFASFRERDLDLSPLAVVKPELSVAPAPGKDGRLRLAGLFPTRPLAIKFDMLFEPIGDVWLLVDLSVAAVDASPAPVTNSQDPVPPLPRPRPSGS